MAVKQPLSLFVSGDLAELDAEQRAVHEALAGYAKNNWLWERRLSDLPAIARGKQRHLSEVEDSDVYVCLFWLHYNESLVEEVEYALKHARPCLIYTKHMKVEQRDPRLTRYLKRLEQLSAPDTLSLQRFSTPAELGIYVQQDVMRLLFTCFRDSRRQPPPLPSFNATTTGAKNKGLVINSTMPASNRTHPLH